MSDANPIWLAAALMAATTSPSLAAGPPKPPEGLLQTFPGCRWEEVRGRQFSIWSCNARDYRLVADDRLPGFVMEQDGRRPRPSEAAPGIRLFKKAAKAPLQSVLLQVRASSRGKYTAGCNFVPYPFPPEAQGRRFSLAPTGEAAKAFKDSQAGSTDIPEDPCGPLGEGAVGDRYFEVAAGDATTVVFFNMGSEIQIFDPSTLRPNGRR